MIWNLSQKISYPRLGKGSVWTMTICWNCRYMGLCQSVVENPRKQDLEMHEKVKKLGIKYTCDECDDKAMGCLPGNILNLHLLTLHF